MHILDFSTTVFTFKQIGYQEIRKMIIIATKIILGIHILIYFGTSLVVCNNDIPFCRKRFNELRENEKDWRNRYLDGEGQNLATPRCEADKEYNYERMCMYKKMCFHINKGLPVEPYLLIKSTSEIHAIDLTTLNTTVAAQTTTIATLKTTVATLKTTVPTLKTTVATLKTTVATLKTTVATLKTTVATLKTTVATLKTTVATLNTTVVISGLARGRMEIDTLNNNLYIADNNSISRVNLDDHDMCVEVILQNVSVDDIAVDWTQRRLYWTEYSKKQISVANLDGNNRTMLMSTTSYPSGIAMDATWRYLFWTEHTAKLVRGISLAPKYMVMSIRTFSEAYAITVDCTKKRVYWLEIRSGVDHIVSSDYDGLEQKTIISGSLNDHLLGVLGDSLYFMNNDLFYVNEMNISNGNIFRNILVDNNSYYDDLVVVHSSIQPQQRMSSLRKSAILAIKRIEFHNKLEEWLPRQGYWRICWRASEHGWAASTFHRRCDGKVPTLTIVQVVKNNKNMVFGGYATRSWAQPRFEFSRTSAPGSFIFSLRNNDDLAPFKAPLRDENDGRAINRHGGYGPTFGRDEDLHIADNARSNAWSLTRFGRSYQSPSGYTYGETKTFSLLAGSLFFTPSEIETLYLI